MTGLNEIVTWIRRTGCLLLCTLFLVPLSFAQVVYQCDFEDEEERAQWLLNDGPRANLCLNNWYISEAVNATRDGAYGLFVSNTGEAPSYTGTYNCLSVATRELTLPEGDYTLFFDWMAKGKAASGEGIWFCWVPDTVDTYSARTLRSLWVDQYRIDSVFNSSSIWKQGKLSFHSDGSRHKLAVVWTNTGGTVTAPPAGCVDNIMIIPKEDECPPPSDFTRTMNGTTMRISWKGEADWYDARVFDYEAQTWQYFDSVTLKRLDLDGLSEGMAQVFVRSHCNKGGISEYALYTPFYFLPGRCINYLGIDDRARCATFVGTATVPRGIQMLVDSGYASEFSRHTLHYVPDETDPRTDNMLKTKPDGALASVRLGNWRVGAEGECIEYTYDVPDGDVAILKLKYAIVLNQPSTPHDENVQSSFQLHIFYSEPGKNRQIALPGGCGDAHFHIGYGDQTGWHAVGNGETMYKEWTEVAVNLREYVGKRITVQLSTADCTAGGHFSYAYFTLDCESGELSGLNCGEDNPTTSFTAPSGFDYEWYLPGNPGNILSTDQTFTISPMDTMLYHVDVISQTNDKCYYTLDACGIPRYPVAKADYKWNGGEHCRNEVTFYNQSYIYYKNIERWNKDQRTDTVYTNNEKVQEVTWDFGDGEIVVSSADSIVHVYPAGGGEYHPTVSASISDGACVATSLVTDLELPDVSIEEREIHISKGTMFNGRVYWEPYEFDDILMEDGCEILAHVHVHETQFTVDTSFCEGGYFLLGEEHITASGTYKGNLKSLQWPEVDSIVTLHLEVEPALVVSLPDTVSVCGGEPVIVLPVTVEQGRMDSLRIVFSETAVSAGFEPEYAFEAGEEVVIDAPENITPGLYPATVKLGTPRCPAPDVPVVVQISYPSSVIDQKDGIIALLNEDYNGGYSFSAYQWYRNGVLIDGATGSYLVVGADDLGAQYSVVLTRSTDGVKVSACPVVYDAAQAVEYIPEAGGEWMLMDMMGRVMVPLAEHKQPLTLSPGVYILVRPGKHQTAKIVVR